MAKPREPIFYESTETTYKELKAIETSSPKTASRPKSLPLTQLHIADRVFQPRILNGNMEADYEHTHDLVGWLRSSGEPLDPILVIPVGERFYVVDGHHRHAAYLTAKWKKRVPVEVFPGTLKDALAASGTMNSKNKLPMTTWCKREYAWRLVKLREHSINETAAAASLSRKTITNMRRERERLGDAVAEGMTWREVLRGQLNKLCADPEYDYRETKAHELANAIFGCTAIKVTMEIDILCRALDVMDGGLIRKIVRERFHEVVGMVEEIREENPEWETLDI